MFRKAWPAGWLLLAMTALLPAAVSAQAWLPEPGQGSIYVGYEYNYVHWTLLPNDQTGLFYGPYPVDGSRVAKGEHYSQIVTVDLDYGIRKGLALTAHVPYLASKYVGIYPTPDAPEESTDPAIHFGTRGVDDGNYHATLQDAEVGLHQTVLSEPFAATPFVAYLFPLQSYASDGHAAAGKNLRELKVGAALARTLRPFLPDAYGQATYTYTAAERALDHTTHLNKVDMELGYFVTPKLSLKGAASYVRTSGGIEWLRGIQNGNTWIEPNFAKYRVHHDRLANERSWRVGGGAGYALTPRYLLYMYGFGMVYGANTQSMWVFASGVGWNFATPWARTSEPTY